MKITPIQWTPSPSAALERQLSERGWRLVRRGGSIIIQEKPVPASLGEPWVWVSRSRPSHAQLVDALKRGVVDVIDATQPDWFERLDEVLQRVLSPQVKVPDVPGFVAASPAAQAVLRDAQRAAGSRLPVLLTGETGTGKEVIARQLHGWSARAGKAFVPINCAAIPNELMEGELFGYVRGAFSGATRDYDGQLVAGDGGTVFLDEIDDTPLPLQNKLLRVLEDGVVSRLGENVWRKVDFRIVAATNRDLTRLIHQGQFGADLYERLSTVQLELPPLRKRHQDLPALCRQLLERYYTIDAPVAGRPKVRSVSPEAMTVLAGYGWPGNVRELRNVLFGALVNKQRGSVLSVGDLPKRLWAESAVTSDDLDQRIMTGRFNLKAEREALERSALVVALKHAKGNAAEAARLLGEVGRGHARDPGGTVRVMMRRLGVVG